MSIANVQVARFAYWQDGPRILNEPPSQPVEKKPADTNTKPPRKNKRAASSNTVVILETNNFYKFN